MTSIVVVGSLNMDLVALAPRLPSVGETLVGSRYFSVAGGKGANQAYAAALLGGDVAMFGRVGDDDYGRQMRASLTEAGCDVTHVASLPGPSGVALITVADSGQNTIIVVPGANDAYDVEQVERDAVAFAGARCALFQLETPLPTVIAAARAAKTAGAQIILDPAPAPDTLPAELLSLVDILTPNETEAARLVGRSDTRLERADAEAIARQLQGRGCGIVIVKMGAQGCFVADRDESHWVSAPSVTARDTTAAGDVFNGALAVALTEGAPLAKACAFAAEAATLSVTRLGAQSSMPRRSEIAFLDELVGQTRA